MFLKHRLSFFYSQSHLILNFLIVDAGYLDVESLQVFPKRRGLTGEFPPGFGRQRAIGNARSTYCLLLDDERFLPEVERPHGSGISRGSGTNHDEIKFLHKDQILSFLYLLFTTFYRYFNQHIDSIFPYSLHKCYICFVFFQYAFNSAIPMIDLAAITNIGISRAGTIGEARTVVLTNKVSVVIFLMSILLFIPYATLYDWNLVTAAIPIVGIFALLSPLFNHYGRAGIARFWLCLLLPASCLVVSVASKLTFPVVQDSEYYDFRFIMVVSAIIPCVLFRMKEAKLMYAAIAFHFVALALYDPLHNLMGAGYYQLGQVDGSYYFTNVVVIFTLTLMVISILGLKKVSESSEEKNLLLIKDLEERGKRNEAQKEQILRQSNILSVNQQKLADAYQLI